MNIQLNIRIDDRIICFVKNVLAKKRAVMPMIILTVVFSAGIYAATDISVPHVFHAGGVISADEVNENFEVLFQKVNELARDIQAAPVGAIAAFAGPDDRIPEGWLLCDGRLLESTDPEFIGLFQVIGTFWGNQGTQFRLPDLRGEFLRGVDGDRNLDHDSGQRKNFDGTLVGNIIGSYQLDAFQTHVHHMRRPGDSRDSSGDGSMKWHSAPVLDEEGTGEPRSGRFSTETRPVNAAVNFIIKY